MKKTKYAFLFLALVAVLSLSVASPLRLAQAQKNGDGGASSPLKYPETKTVETVDDYFGTKVADPYRWLENNDSPEVAAWVEAQNKVTFAYLDQIPYRAAVKDRLTKLFNYPKYGSPPTPRRVVYLLRRTTACKTRASSTFRKAWTATPELLLDPEQVFRRRHVAAGRLVAGRKVASTSVMEFRKAVQTGMTCTFWMSPPGSRFPIESSG